MSHRNCLDCKHLNYHRLAKDWRCRVAADPRADDFMAEVIEALDGAFREEDGAAVDERGAVITADRLECGAYRQPGASE